MTEQLSTRKPAQVGWSPRVKLAVVSIMTMIMVAAPAWAIDINLSVITDVINAFIDLITPITNLLIAIVPLWFIVQILGFIMGLLAAILAMIKFGTK